MVAIEKPGKSGQVFENARENLEKLGKNIESIQVREKSGNNFLLVLKCGYQNG